ncbi:MAG TPA: acetate kinase, partial [Candidatus Woesearchaeota archaeon]|nr:acetate kinase [Candidatus Woesearchaeota archaeon]
MKILVLNCGSSSIKYEVFEKEDSIFHGLIEKIGEKSSKVKNHEQGIKLMLNKLEEKNIRISSISAVGHRVVHGGLFAKPSLINQKVIDVLEKYSKLAPLHNPVNLKGIYAMQKALPKVPQVAVFDTAFHQTIPEHAFMYAIPYELYKKEKIRRYGFHGTSIDYVSQRAAKLLKKPLSKLKMIVCHLGNGCSICAIDKGKSVDTSMGFT